MRNKIFAVLSIVMLLFGVFPAKISADDVTYDNIAYSEQDMNDISGIAYPKSFAVYDNNDNKLNGISINYSYKYENEYGFDIHISNATYRAIRSDREKYRLHVTYNDDVTVDHGPLYKIAYQKEESPENIMSYSPQNAKYKELYYVIIDRDIYDVQVNFNNNVLLLNDYSEENGKVIWSQNFRQNTDATLNAFYEYIADSNDDFTLTFKKRSDNNDVTYHRDEFTEDNGKLYLVYEINGESGSFILDTNGGGGGGSGYEYDSSKSDVTVVIDKDDQGRYTVNAFKAGKHFDTIYGYTPSARDALISAVDYLQGYVKSKILLNTDLTRDSNIDNDNDIELNHDYIKGWQINFNDLENTNNGLNIDLNGHDITGFRLSIPGSWAIIFLTNSSNTASNITLNSENTVINNEGNVFLLGKVNVINTDGTGISIFKNAEKTYINKDAGINAVTGVEFVNSGNVGNDDLNCSLTVLGSITASSTGISFNAVDDNSKHRYYIDLYGTDQSRSVINSNDKGISVTGKPEVNLMNCNISAKNAFYVSGGNYDITSCKITSSDGPLFFVDTNSEDSRQTSITIKADSGVELEATDYIVLANADNDNFKEASFYAEDSEVSNGYIKYGQGLVSDISAAKVKVRGGCYSKNDISSYLVDPLLSVVPSTKYQGFYTVVIPDSTKEVSDYESLKEALESVIITTINVNKDILGSQNINFNCDVSKRINLNEKELSGFALIANTEEVKQSGDENTLTINNGIISNENGNALVLNGPRTFLNKVVINTENNEAIILKNGELIADADTHITGYKGIVISEDEQKSGHLANVNLNGTNVITNDSAIDVVNTTDKHHTYIWLIDCTLTMLSEENPLLDIKDNAVIEIDASTLIGGSYAVYFDDENIKKVGNNFYSRLRIVNESNIISVKGLRLAEEVECESYDTIIMADSNVIETYDQTHLLIASGYYATDTGEIIVILGERGNIEDRTILSGYYSHDMDEYIINGQREGFRYVCEQISTTGVFRFRVMKQFGDNVFFNPQYVGTFDEDYFTRDIDTDLDLLADALKNLKDEDTVILSVEDARHDEETKSFPEGEYEDYYDIYLNRKTEQVEEADNYVIVKIRYENADNLKIYHKHGNNITQIKKVEPAYGKSLIEECYFVEDGAINIVVKRFSLFGIQDYGSVVPVEKRASTPSYVMPKTGIE
ncbi:MAG: hypothetical protein IJH00_01560 [Erysipelotrichaceae bacterium]|nr:hypothetical protein [Erysipelotrichaceae bacterium]